MRERSLVNVNNDAAGKISSYVLRILMQLRIHAFMCDTFPFIFSSVIEELRFV